MFYDLTALLTSDALEGNLQILAAKKAFIGN